MAQKASKKNKEILPSEVSSNITAPGESLSATPRKYFLRYQENYLADESQRKIWEKSRRIGATYVQSYEDVVDCLKKKVPAVWFSSADESAAREYIIYCAMWAKVFNVAAKDLGEIVVDKEKDVKAFVIEFSNGSRINALSSNPTAFRSKGGKVVLDEFAHHKDAFALWKAAKPTVTWGFPLRVLSTHNGIKTQFYKFIDGVKKGKLKWSLHFTDIYTAVNDGLYDKILGRKATDQEREEWLKELEDDCFDKVTWDEEYCCIPSDESTAFIDYELIGKCEELNIIWQQDYIQVNWNGKKDKIKEPQHSSMMWVHAQLDLFDKWLKSLNPAGRLFLGLDIGRRKDLTVIWVVEKLLNIKITRSVIVLEQMNFWVQEAILYSFLSHPAMYRACIDETGMGIQLAERAKEKFGEAKVEPVNFSAGGVRNEMAFHTKSEFEDRAILIPHDDEIREDIHSMKKVTTSTNAVRLVADNDGEVVGHADRFWGLSLALHACKTDFGSVNVSSGGRRQSKSMLDKYWRNGSYD